MSRPNERFPWQRRVAGCAAGLGLLAFLIGGTGTAQKPATDARTDYASAVQPLLKKYCLGCHSTKEKKGSLDLERFATLADARKHLKVWQGVVEQLEAGEMPPKEKPQPTAAPAAFSAMSKPASARKDASTPAP